MTTAVPSRMVPVNEKEVIEFTNRPLARVWNPPALRVEGLTAIIWPLMVKDRFWKVSGVWVPTPPGPVRLVRSNSSWLPGIVLLRSNDPIWNVSAKAAVDASRNSKASIVIRVRDFIFVISFEVWKRVCGARVAPLCKSS